MSDWTDQPTSIRQGEELNTDRLQQYLQTQLPASGSDLSVHQFPSGFSNLTYSLEYGGQAYVLRRPPFGANIKSAHDMSREYHILSNLIKVYPKVPRPLLYCEDEAVLGAPFYIMERVQGVILRPHMPAPMQPDAPTMAGIAEALVDTLVELHAVDYKAAGLAELGRPEGYVERQVSGWTKRYFKAKTDEVPEIEQAAAWLADNLPATSATTLIHNDFKYDNLVLHSDDWTQVKAVLDWEMATIGDPLMDLGTSIGYWLNPNDPELILKMQLSPTTLSGNPSRGELAQLYAEKSGRDLGQLVFYYVFGVFKIAVIVQQIYARYKKGYTQDPRFAGLIHAVRGLGIMAQQSIQKGRIDDLF
ncbi:MAG: phosphotransferase family protein [Bacteroidota bacterium]